MSKTPSIAVIPSGYKASKVYSVLPTNGDADLDFTRNCVATRVNQNGLLEEVGLNVPRLDYSDGGCPSLLLEPSSTNYITNSIQGGFLANATIGETIVSPSGLVDAIVPLSTFSTSAFTTDLAPSTFQTDDILTYSWYRKRISGTTLDGSIGDITLAPALVNLTVEGVTEQIASNINGFDRFQASVKVVDGSIQSTLRAYFGFSSVLGSLSVAYYGHQLEKGTYATSLIYTSGTEVTRFADQSSKDNLESYINSSEGVFYAEINAINESDVQRCLSLSDGIGTNRVLIRVNANSSTVFANLNNVGLSETIDINAYNKVAIKWGTNVFKLFINGVLVGSKTDLITVVGLDTLSYSYGNVVSEPLHGKTKDIRVYNEALTDAELITLTQ